jgi:hypothetical protein
VQNAIARIQRVAIVANGQKNLVELRFEKTALEISTESQEHGNKHEKIAIVYEGKLIEIAFNHVFICYSLKVLDTGLNLGTHDFLDIKTSKNLAFNFALNSFFKKFFLRWNGNRNFLYNMITI